MKTSSILAMVFFLSLGVFVAGQTASACEMGGGYDDSAPTGPSAGGADAISVQPVGFDAERSGSMDQKDLDSQGSTSQDDEYQSGTFNPGESYDQGSMKLVDADFDLDAPDLDVPDIDEPDLDVPDLHVDIVA